MRTHHKPLDQGFALWQPDLGWLKIANAQLHHSFVAITGEWQAFVGRRVQEDLRLWEELAGAKAPAELWSAYTKFWQTAVEDYRHEYLTLSNLYAEAVTAGTTAQQQASEAALLLPQSGLALGCRRPNCRLLNERHEIVALSSNDRRVPLARRS